LTTHSVHPASVVGIGSADYARRFGATWRPSAPAETLDLPPPITFPGGPGTPSEIGFPGLSRLRVPELGVLEIEGARLIAPSGWILGAEGLLLADHTWSACELDEHRANEGRFAASIARTIAGATRVTLPGATLSLLTDFGCVNYHHFLVDALGRLAVVEAAGIDLGSVDRILVPKPCSENARRILAAMPLPPEKLVTVDSAPGIEFLPERLLAPSFPGAPRCTRPIVPRFLRARLLRQPPPARAATRIYVDRTGPRRPLENRSDVLALMEEHGFEIYDPHEHDDQPADFSAAGVIVGAHGAGLTNILFAPEGAKVLELIPGDQIHPYYYTLALATGLDHRFLPCRSDGERPAGTFGPSPFPFRVDIDALRGALTAIGCDAPRRRALPAPPATDAPLDSLFERSIVVAAVGARPSIEAALRAAAAGVADDDRCELVVAGITDDDLAREIRSRFRDATVVVTSKSLSAAEARTCGAAAARGQRLLRVDGDRVVPARWVEGQGDSPSAPRGASTHEDAARTCLARGDTDGAILHYRQAIADSPQPPRVPAALAQALLEQDRLDEAERIFLDLVRRYPDDPVGYLGRARLRQSRQAAREALDAWKEVSERFPDRPVGPAGVAWALVDLGRFDEAEAVLEEAAKTWPEADAPPVGLARAAAASGRFQLAHERWKNLSARFPKIRSIQMNYARSLANLGDLREALRVYESVVEGSRTPMTLCVRADLHVHVFDWPAVMDLIREIGDSDADDLAVGLRLVDLLTRLAFYHCDPRHLDRAVTLGERLVGRFPHSTRAHQALVESYVTARRDDEAARLLGRLPADPIGSQATARLEAWRRSRLGDIEGARRISRMDEASRNYPTIHGPPGTFRQLDRRPVTPAPGEVLLFTVLRNEVRRLPWFLSVYRTLGVDRFIVIDNDSTDGGTEFLLDQPDVHLFHTTDSYARAWSGMRWINQFVERFGAGHWCLYVDVDERLVFPGVEESGLPPLLRHMERKGHDALRAFMLDMHGPTSGYRPEYRSGMDPLPLYPYFDKTHHRYGAVRCPYWHVTGGIRRIDGNSHNLTKTPIIRGGGVIRFLSSSHQTTPATVSDVSGVLLHFKLAGGPDQWSETTIGDRLPGCIRRHQRDSLGVTSEDGDVPLVGESTVRYRSSRQLVDLGLIDCPADYPAPGSPEGAIHDE